MGPTVFFLFPLYLSSVSFFSSLLPFSLSAHSLPRRHVLTPAAPPRSAAAGRTDGSAAFTVVYLLAGHASAPTPTPPYQASLPCATAPLGLDLHRFHGARRAMRATVGAVRLPAAHGAMACHWRHGLRAECRHGRSGHGRWLSGGGVGPRGWSWVQTAARERSRKGAGAGRQHGATSPCHVRRRSTSPTGVATASKNRCWAFVPPVPRLPTPHLRWSEVAIIASSGGALPGVAVALAKSEPSCLCGRQLFSWPWLSSCCC